MKLLLALRLLLNFLRDAVWSGWDTARIILYRRGTFEDGIIRMRYGQLDPGPASLLAAMVTLTPGTTVVDIDVRQREFVLHLLDVKQQDVTIETIRRDLILPLERLFS
jgi:multisubunit Na+/H+ antiporter MnhE subunit